MMGDVSGGRGERSTAFFTAPDGASLWWSIILLVLTALLLLRAGVATRPATADRGDHVQRARGTSPRP